MSKKNFSFDAEHITRNLIFDGRLTDAELSECCDVPLERVHELVVESALTLREQMLRLREMLNVLRQDGIPESEQCDTAIAIVFHLKLILQYYECEGPERDEITSYMQGLDIRTVQSFLYPLNPAESNFEILYAGKQILHKISADILAEQYK